MSTSKLQRKVSRLLSAHLGQCTFRENYRSEWLDGLELDFYIPAARIAIEVQGRQHYEYVHWYHKSPRGFHDQLERDRRKRAICDKAGIRLIELSSDSDLDLLESLRIVQVTADEMWTASEQKRKELERTMSPRVKAGFNHLHSLCERLGKWRRKRESPKKRAVVHSIEGSISAVNLKLQGWLSKQ